MGAAALFGAPGCTVTSSSSDAGDDGAITTDSGTKDTGTKDTGPAPDGGSLACTPADVTNYTPTYHNPNAIQSVCVDADISGYWTACLDTNSTQTTCQTFTTAHQTCSTCLETLDPSTASWGALVDRGPSVYLNVSGCVGLSGDANCAKALQAAELCGDAACLDPCWNNSQMQQADADALDACYQAVSTTSCKKFEDDANAKCNSSAQYTQCNPSAFDQATFTRYGNLFCQGGG